MAQVMGRKAGLAALAGLESRASTSGLSCVAGAAKGAGAPGGGGRRHLGALTSKPYAYTARPWELKNRHSIDITDGIGSNIRVDYRDTEVMRILPRRNDDINLEWISDKARWHYDGLKRQRLDVPLADAQVLNWKQALDRGADLLAGPDTVFVVGDTVDMETMTMAKDVARAMGSRIVTETPHADNVDLQHHYQSEMSMNDVSEKADVVLFVGMNPRLEGLLLSMRMRYHWRMGDFYAAGVGGTYDQSFPVDWIGVTPEALIKIAEGKHPVSAKLAQASNPVVMYSQSVYNRVGTDSADLQRVLRSLKLRGVTPVPFSMTASQTGASALGIRHCPKAIASAKAVYMIGCNHTERISDLKRANKDVKIVYQGTHGDEHVALADLILPGAAYVEQVGTYMNFEGRPQQTGLALPPPQLAREDWAVLRAVAGAVKEKQEAAGTCKGHFDHVLEMESKEQVVARMHELVPATANPSKRETSSFSVELAEGVAKTTLEGKDGAACKVYNTPLKPGVVDFHRTDQMCKASHTMAAMSRQLRTEEHNYLSFERFWVHRNFKEMKEREMKGQQ